MAHWIANAIVLAYQTQGVPCPPRVERTLEEECCFFLGWSHLRDIPYVVLPLRQIHMCNLDVDSADSAAGCGGHASPVLSNSLTVWVKRINSNIISPRKPCPIFHPSSCGGIRWLTMGAGRGSNSGALLGIPICRYVPT